jgi:hypothetical protein
MIDFFGENICDLASRLYVPSSCLGYLGRYKTNRKIYSCRFDQSDQVVVKNRERFLSQNFASVN